MKKLIALLTVFLGLSVSLASLSAQGCDRRYYRDSYYRNDYCERPRHAVVVVIERPIIREPDYYDPYYDPYYRPPRRCEPRYGHYYDGRIDPPYARRYYRGGY